MILKCFTRDHHQYPFRLREQLGHWTTSEFKATTFYSRQNDAVYVQEGDDKYRRFHRHTQQHVRRPEYIRAAQCFHLPPDALPTTTKGTATRVIHTGTTGYIPIPLPRNDDWWGIVTSATITIDDLATAIKLGTAIAVTDGSYKDNMGTTAFTIKSDINDIQSILTCVHMTPGQPHKLTPFRAEIGGLFGIASFLD